MGTLSVWWLLVACDLGPSYAEVEKTDTIEAYEMFLAADPESIYKYTITKRLEELYYEKGLREGTTAIWSTYLEKFPEGAHRDAAEREYAFAAYAEAVKAGTPGAMRAWLQAFPKADRRLTSKAEGRATLLEYGKISLAEPVVERVNMAEDPKGEKNGWGVSAEITNGGDATFDHVVLGVDFVGDDGAILLSKEYPLTSKHWTMPHTDLEEKPFGPGEKRTWRWTEGDDTVPAAWKQKAVVTVTGLRKAP